LTLSATVVTLAASATLLAAPAPTVAVSAPGHTPVIGTHWNYTVSVTRAGKPLAAKLTEQIVDPVGGVHPVQFGTSTKNITNWPVTGSFKDFIVWPADARGIPLTFRVTVHVGSLKRVINYAVTPRT
jgi:hypothetical protein